MTDQKFYPPSIDPSAKSDFSGIIDFVLTKFLQRTDDMLPAIVQAYDRASNRAQVQPLIAIVATDNTRIPRGALASVPVLQMGGGGFVLSFPLNPGDLGWIKSNDRDISLFLQTLKSSPPNTARFHSFENGIFIPDTMFKGVSISGGDSTNAVLQSLDGSVKISLGADKITILAPTVDVECVTATVNASGEVDITSPQVKVTASSKITLDSPTTEITGSLTCTSGAGTASFAGSIIVTGDVTANGTSLHTHVHSGVQTGASDTGPPV